jgi:uncharacterized YccA/Bax inhibitor family protein
MQSSNPVFMRSDGFNGQPANRSASGMTYPGHDAPQAPTYTPDPQGQHGGQQYGGTQAPVGTGRMTLDSVVQKTGLTLAVVTVVATGTWLMTGDPTVDESSLTQLYLLSMVGAFGGFALAMVNSFKRVISPGLVLAYAALQGLFVGAFSKSMEAYFGDGLVMGAVLGTIAAVAGTLAAYKFFNIQVGTRFRKWVVAAMFGFVALSLLDLVLGFFGASFGFNGFGTMGLVASVVGLGLGVLMLILDFDFVERGIAAGLPERESWRAAFGLTVTIIWIYIELLRILAILRGND